MQPDVVVVVGDDAEARRRWLAAGKVAQTQDFKIYERLRLEANFIGIPQTPNQLFWLLGDSLGSPEELPAKKRWVVVGGGGRYSSCCCCTGSSAG